LTPTSDSRSAVFEATLPGTYSVSLTSRGETRTATIYVVNAPPGGARESVLYDARAGAAIPYKFSAVGKPGRRAVRQLASRV
jgi:PKD repeat protein